MCFELGIQVSDAWQKREGVRSEHAQSAWSRGRERAAGGWDALSELGWRGDM